MFREKRALRFGLPERPDSGLSPKKREFSPKNKDFEDMAGDQPADCYEDFTPDFRPTGAILSRLNKCRAPWFVAGVQANAMQSQRIQSPRDFRGLMAEIVSTNQIGWFVSTPHLRPQNRGANSSEVLRLWFKDGNLAWVSRRQDALLANRLSGTGIVSQAGNARLGRSLLRVGEKSPGGRHKATSE